MTHLKEMVLNLLLLPMHLTKALLCSLLVGCKPLSFHVSDRALGRQRHRAERYELGMREIWFSNLTVTSGNKNRQYHIFLT